MRPLFFCIVGANVYILFHGSCDTPFCFSFLFPVSFAEKIEDFERLGQLAIGPLHDQRFLLKSVDEELRYRVCSIKDQHEIAQR